MTLIVWWDDEEVGELAVVEDALRFRYTASATRTISRALPMRDDWQPGRFFSNLLPDGSLRDALARRFGVSPDNDFALLEKVGGDCAGALALLPKGQVPATLERGQEPLVTSRIHDLSSSNAGLVQALSTGRARLSLAGAQGKIPVVLDSGELWTPIGATASTHILKLPSRDLKRISINELFMLQLAKDLGLPAVDARLWPAGEESALLVTRFDRNATKRIHQEDFCQATGRSPKQKYEEEGGPSFAEIVQIIREESAEPALDVDIALNWLAFNIVCGNADGHAKNLALIRTDTVRLAPLYDLVCTRAWTDFGADVAIGVGGQRDPGQIASKHWAGLAADCGLGAAFVMNRVKAMVAKAPPAARELATRLKEEGVDPRPLNELPVIIDRLCRRAEVLLRESATVRPKRRTPTR